MVYKAHHIEADPQVSQRRDQQHRRLWRIPLLLRGNSGDSSIKYSCRSWAKSLVGRIVLRGFASLVPGDHHFLLTTVAILPKTPRETAGVGRWCAHLTAFFTSASAGQLTYSAECTLLFVVWIPPRVDSANKGPCSIHAATTTAVKINPRRKKIRLRQFHASPSGLDPRAKKNRSLGQLYKWVGVCR